MVFAHVLIWLPICANCCKRNDDKIANDSQADANDSAKGRLQ